MAIPVEDFYRRYAPMVLRRCRRLLGEEEQAADAMHDVFVQLLVHHERLVDHGASSLMYRIAGLIDTQLAFFVSAPFDYALTPRTPRPAPTSPHRPPAEPTCPP